MCMVKLHRPSKKTLIIILAVIILTIAGAGVAFALLRDSRDNAKPDISTESNTEGINLNPPTHEDAERVESNKQEIIDREERFNSQSTNGSRSVKPVITYAGQYGGAIEVGAYVDIFEDGGTCTATFTQGVTKIVRSVEAVRSARSTDCPVMSVNASEFNPKGVYSLVVVYSSPSASGTSDTRNIEVK